MFDNAIIGETLGGSLHTGECAYRYSSTSAPVDKLVRRGVYSGGFAHYTFCALRLAHAPLTHPRCEHEYRFRIPCDPPLKWSETERRKTKNETQPLK